MWIILPLLILSAIVFAGTIRKRKQKNRLHSFPDVWRIALLEHVDFYVALKSEDRKAFEERMLYFLNHVNISGVDTEIEELDRVLIGASAIIPIFGFPEWRYANVQEIMLYPGNFNKKYETEGEGRSIRGMVGTGSFMEGRMMLSQHALRLGFSNNSDKRNTAVHEFVHLVDKHDGAIDGLPDAILRHPNSIPWLSLIEKKTAEIRAGESDIDGYAATEQTEFFAVVSEYFFERPKLMAQRHPQLYAQLELFFKQDMDEMTLDRKREEIGRNDPCPCGSGKKYKKCHYVHD
jgi:Mlc titration factor MtfA (ptsG expression regulator)